MPTPQVLPTEQCITEGYCPPKHRGHRDTKRWCRGKVGREHRYQWHADLLNWLYARLMRYMIEHPVCLDCGKHRHEARYLCTVCRVPSNRTDFGVKTGGLWAPLECPVCYADWRR